MQLTNDELEFREKVELVSRTAVEPLIDRQRDQPLSPDVCRQLLDIARPLGLLGARVPRDLGGSGLGAVKLALAAEVFPYEAWEVISLPEIVAFRISCAGNDTLKRRVIPMLVGGARFAGSATSEFGAGSDPQSMGAVATPEGEGFRIRARKAWCAGGLIADVLLVVASLGVNAQGRKRLAPFIVDRTDSGFTTRPHHLMGLNKCQISEIELDCWVPRENMIGDAEGGAQALLNRTWLSQRPIMGLCSVRMGNQAYEWAVAYAKSREQFGKPIGSFQLIQSMIAEMAAALDASRLLCFRAIRMAEAGAQCMKETALAKYFSVKSSLEVTASAVEICGAQGVLKGNSAEKYFRDARCLAFVEGTLEIQKLIAGREILGIRAFS